MGDSQSEDKLQLRVTWELNKVLTRMGFNIEKLVHEALESMVSKACWRTKFNVLYYDFLTQPAKYIKESWVMLDESWIYAGEGERKGVVRQGEPHIKKKAPSGGSASLTQCSCIGRSLAKKSWTAILIIGTGLKQ